MKYILTIDQGTTSSRSIIFNHKSEIVAVAQQPYEQIYPTPGWVEHNPADIWNSQLSVLQEVLQKSGINTRDIAALGITNQRETTVVWDRTSGQPIYNAIVWQDRRTANYCASLQEQGWSQTIQRKTGLVLDAYFSATKLKWILDHVEGARERAERGELCFGTVDTWLVWNLTGGKQHITDATNASRTMLFNIHTQEWDTELLTLFNIPHAMLPTVHNSSEVYGQTFHPALPISIPIAGIAGDQQAALFGQLCLEPGMLKTTYGTGCFMVMNTGSKPITSGNNLLTTVGWRINGHTTYALEGSVFIGGAAIQWLRDGLHLFEHASQTEAMATSVEDNGGVYFVPALSGLGAPYWDSYARGTIVGITRGTTSNHLTRAALEGIAFQVNDVLTSMQEDIGESLKQIKVDGGAVANNFLMQFQADISNCPVARPQLLESTALGAAYLAGLAVGYWENLDHILKQSVSTTLFSPSMPHEKRQKLLSQWAKAVGRSLKWEE